MRTRSYLAFIQRACASVLALVAALFLIGLLSPSSANAQEPGMPANPSLIVKMIAGLTAEEQAAVIARNGGVEKSGVPALRLHVIEVTADTLDQVLASYKADPQVMRAEVNNVRQTDRVANDTLYSGQRALPKIRWDVVFESSTPMGTATVAVLDTEVSWHPDLAVNLVPGASFVGSSTGPDQAHGTWVAGIIAAESNSEGVAGVGYAGVRVMPVRVLNGD